MLAHRTPPCELEKAPCHLGGDGRAFQMLPCQEMWPTPSCRGCPWLQAAINLSSPLWTEMNVSGSPESIKGPTSTASTPGATTSASALLAWGPTQRTRGCAKLEPLGRSCEAGLELGKELIQVAQPEEAGEDPQVPKHQGPAEALPRQSPP